MQKRYGIPSAQEEEDALVHFHITMDHNDRPEVMMLSLEEIQLFFIAHPEGSCRYMDTQFIHQAIKNLRACGSLYVKALSIWNSKESTYCITWVNLKTTINEQFVRILAKIGGTMLTDDEYKAFNAIADEDTMALTESIVEYAEQSARADTRVNGIKARSEKMVVNPQPLGLGLPT